MELCEHVARKGREDKAGEGGDPGDPKGLPEIFMERLPFEDLNVILEI